MVKQGNTVLVQGLFHNGTNVHPALVTRVFPKSDGGVQLNTKIFVDNGPTIDRLSIDYFETREAAQAHADEQMAVPVFVAFPVDPA